MLPIATVQGVKNGISTGMIIDLSDYLKKTEGVTKSEFTALETTVSGKLDTEPQHKHDISDVKNLHEALDGKYDTSKKYPHNVILSDTDKIAYIESPKVQHLEVAMNASVDGYNFYVDDTNGDLMILSPSSALIASYSIASNSWTFGGVSLKDIANNETIAEHEELIRANSVDIVSNLAKLTAVQDKLNTHTHAAIEAKITERETGVQSNTTDIKNNSDVIADLNRFIEERINELYKHKSETEAILKNHYDALMLLLEKHDMVDSNTGDGSNVSPA